MLAVNSLCKRLLYNKICQSQSVPHNCLVTSSAWELVYAKSQENDKNKIKQATNQDFFYARSNLSSTLLAFTGPVQTRHITRGVGNFFFF